MVGVEYRGGGGAEGLDLPQRFYKGGSAFAEILLELIALTILANAEPLMLQKMTTFIHSKFSFIHKLFVFIGNYLAVAIYNLYMLSGSLSWSQMLY